MARPLKPRPPTPCARDLYRKAREYHAARPWEALADDEVFGVEDPETGAVAWCSVLGAAGQMFGLAVYDGAEGLALYQGIMNDTVPVDDVQMSHRGFLVAFGSRDVLERSEIEALRADPGSPPARGTWPMVRRLEPGYPPALPDDPACGRLAIVLDQVLAVAASARGRTDAVAPDGEGRLVIRRRHRDGSWLDVRVPPQQPAPPAVPGYRDELRLRRVGRLPQTRGVAWECDYAFAPIVVADTGRGPAYAAVVLVVDHASGVVLHAKLGPPPLDATFLQEEFVLAIEGARARPQTVLTRTAVARAMLEPVATAVRFAIEGPARVPALEHARAALVEHMTRRS